MYIYIVVLFPAPLCPSKAVIWPSKKLSVKLSTAVLVLNFRLKSLIDIPMARLRGSVSIYLSFARRTFKALRKIKKNCQTKFSLFQKICCYILRIFSTVFSTRFRVVS